MALDGRWKKALKSTILGNLPPDIAIFVGRQMIKTELRRPFIVIYHK